MISFFPQSIYCISSKEIYRLDLQFISRGWIPLLSDIPHSRRFASATAMNGKIYVVGGKNEDEKYLHEMDIYDIQTNTWSTNKQKIPGGTERPLVAHSENNALYLLGGSHDTKVYEFEIQLNTFRRLGQQMNYGMTAVTKIGQE